MELLVRRKELFLILFLLARPAFAGYDTLIVGAESALVDARIAPTDHVVPNEHYPQDALRAFQRASDGLYLSVGTERGFIGAANGGRITHLLLVDYDTTVVSYNLLNIYLLRLSRGREDYIRLRQGKLDEWLERASALNFDENQLQFMRNQYKGWARVSFSNQYQGSFGAQPATRKSEFYSVNYLYDDAQYGHLKRMADEGKIGVMLANLGNASDVSKIIGEIQSRGIPIGALDFSNAWWGRYIPEEKMANTLQLFSQIASDKSLLITTEGYPLLNHFVSERWMWTYSAYTFKKIRNARSMTSFVKSLYKSRMFPFLWKLRVFGWASSRVPCTLLVKDVNAETWTPQ